MSDLYDVIDNNTDEQRWHAIEVLRKKYTLKEICENTDITYGSLRVWISNNRKKYELKHNAHNPSLTHRNPAANDGQSSMTIDNLDQSIKELIQKEQWHMEEMGIDTTKLPSQGHYSKQIELPKYGEIVPSLMISTLSHHEWGRKIWGEYKFRWELPYITELEQGLWEADQTAWELPRFHGKTETVIKLGVRETAEKLHPYLLITNKFLVDRLFKMWASYYMSRNFRLMYGDIIDVKNGYIQLLSSNKTGWVNREYIDWHSKDPLFQVISKDQEAIGGHPGHMHYEDILQKMPKSETTFDDLKQMIQDDWMPMLSMEEDVEGRQTGTWTRKELGDLYEWFREELNWRIINHKGVRGVLPHEGEYQWDDDMRNITYISDRAIKNMDLLNPHQDPKQILKMAIMTPASYASQIQNDPIQRGNTYFDYRKWKKIQPFDTSSLVTTGGCDAALGENASDTTCILYMTWYKGNIIITDLFLDKNIGFNQVVQKNIDMYNANRPDRFIMHADRSDIAVVQSLRDKMYFETYQNKLNKVAKIEAFKEYESVRNIYYFSTIPPQYIKEMIKQVQMFDRRKSTATKHDDYLDIQVTLYQMTKDANNQSYVGKTWTSKR